MTRSEALDVARGQRAISGQDWVVFYDRAIGDHWVKLREQPKTVEVIIIELCACGQCKPNELRCVAANVSAGDYKLEPSVQRSVNGTAVTRYDALTPSFDASKLDDLDRVEKIALAATPGPWHRGYWSYVYDQERKQTTGVRLEVDLRPDYREGEDDLRVSHAKPSDKLGTGNIVIGGCGCCNSPFGRAVDAEHIVAAAPDATLQLVRRAKMLARFVELCERWLVTLMTVENEYRLVLSPKPFDVGAEIMLGRSRSFRSPNLERLIDHAWANAPEGVV